MRFSILIICVFLGLNSCHKVVKENSLQQNIHIIGGTSNSVAFKMISLSDGGFALTGFITGITGRDMFVTKLSEDGKILWTQTYGEEKDEVGRSIIELKDGGFMIGGYTTSYFNEAVTACLIRIDKNGNLLWRHIYPHKASPGINLKYEPLFLDHIHLCKDGTFNLYEYNKGDFSPVGLYSYVTNSPYFHIEKVDFNGNFIRDTIYNFSLPGHPNAGISNLFGYPESETGTMKTLEISLMDNYIYSGAFYDYTYRLWNGNIDESNFNYVRQDSIIEIAGAPFLPFSNVRGFLFGLNTARSTNGKMIISCVEAEKTFLVIADENGKNVAVKNFPELVQGMNVSNDSNIALAGTNYPDGNPTIILLGSTGNLIWKKSLDCKTQFIGREFYQREPYWGSLCTLAFNKKGEIVAAFTVQSPDGGKTDIGIVHLNQKGELVP